jgi:hypothetical protein
MRIHITTSPQRKKPKTGDIRTTKKHGMQIRIPYKIDGMYIVSNGRQLYEWVKPEDLPNLYKHLAPKEYVNE